MPKSSTPALLLTMVRSFVPLRRTAAMRFSGMPQRPKPPMRMVAPSWILSMAASAEAMRLSIWCSEVFGEVYFIRYWSGKTSLQAAKELVEFLVGGEVGFDFAAGKALAAIIKRVVRVVTFSAEVPTAQCGYRPGP